MITIIVQGKVKNEKKISEAIAKALEGLVEGFVDIVFDNAE